MRRNLNFENYCESLSQAREVLLKKSTGFCRMSVTTSLLRLGALLRDILQMGAFPSIDVRFYWFA